MEKLDIKDVRVLIVGGKPYEVYTLREVLAIAGVSGTGRIDVIAEPGNALQFLKESRVHAVFCDEGVGDVDGMPFALAARRAKGILDPMLPIFMVCALPHREDIEAARNIGFTGVLVRPISVATVSNKLHGALETPRQFILSGEFFGPDRRGARRGHYEGENRRKREPEKLEVSPGETSAFLEEPNADVILALVETKRL